MKRVFLAGKYYNDTIIFVNGMNLGDTNEFNRTIEQAGGIYNFCDFSAAGVEFKFEPIGSKKAYIISDKSNSTRTSFVGDQSPSEINMGLIDSINKKADWLHVCYIDDIEKYQNLSLIKIPFSLDFCTLKDRIEYLPIMKEAEIIFDSRERRHLYDIFDIDTPIIFHDQNGIEIVKNKKVVFQQSMVPLENLNVNGAGDIYASHFIKNYFSLDLKESSYRAMIQTTKELTARQYEKI